MGLDRVDITCEHIFRLLHLFKPVHYVECAMNPYLVVILWFTYAVVLWLWMTFGGGSELLATKMEIELAIAQTIGFAISSVVAGFIAFLVSYAVVRFQVK